MLEIKHVSLGQRLEIIHLSVEAGQLVHVLGANGAGKSSLLSVISGLIEPDQGQIKVFGRDLTTISLSELSLFRCYQQQAQQSAFDISVQESLDLFAADVELADDIEHALEISAFLSRSILSLSGGESRRVHIARILLQIWPVVQQGQALILLDEPIQGLDLKHQILLFNLLQQLSKRGNLVIVSHHSLELCDAYADTVWLMKQGRVEVSGKPDKVLNQDTLSHIFDCSFNVIEHENSRLFQSFLG